MPIIDSTVRLANLKSGQLDLIERPLATDLKEMRADQRLKVATVTELGYQGITINVGKGEAAKNPLGQDPRVRRAFELAIDRDALNQVVYNGEYTVGNQWVSPKNPWYQEKYPVPKRDVAKAKKLIQEAGAKTPIAIDFMVPNNPETRQMAEVLQSMTAEAGFDLKVRVTEFATSLNEAEAGRFQAYALNWSGRPDPDGNLYVFHKTGAPQNYGGYSNPQVDAALDEARVKNAIAERKAIYEKVAGHAPRRGLGRLSLPPAVDHRPHGKARRLQAPARRARAGRGLEAEVAPDGGRIIMIASRPPKGGTRLSWPAGRRTLIMIKVPGALTSPLRGRSSRRSRPGEGDTSQAGNRGMVENLLKDRARQMRREPTEAERRMWRLLRDRHLGGFKFRRQEQLGRYIVDFVCFEQKLIVELDGSQHAESAYDADAMTPAFKRAFQRPAVLEQRGVR